MLYSWKFHVFKKRKERDVGFINKWKLGGGEGNDSVEERERIDEREARVGRRDGHKR